jgi:hypothetical protein
MTVVPVAMMPVVAMPVMPVPVTMTPMAVVPAMMAVPAHLHRLGLVDFVLRHDGRLNVYRRGRGHLDRDRRHRRCLRACAKQDRTRNQSDTKFQEIPELHDLKALS